MATLLFWSMYSDLFYFGSMQQGECLAQVGAATYAVALIILFKLILSVIASCWMSYSSDIQQNYSDEQRLMLRRLQVQVYTIKHNVILSLYLLCDILTVISAAICVPIRPIAMEACSRLFTLFLFMLFVYQILVLVRVPLLFCIFICGRRLWTWCKRIPCCSCLNSVEAEQTARFEVYEA